MSLLRAALKGRHSGVSSLNAAGQSAFAAGLTATRIGHGWLSRHLPRTRDLRQRSPSARKRHRSQPWKLTPPCELLETGADDTGRPLRPPCPGPLAGLLKRNRLEHAAAHHCVTGSADFPTFIVLYSAGLVNASRQFRYILQAGECGGGRLTRCGRMAKMIESGLV